MSPHVFPSTLWIPTTPITTPCNHLYCVYYLKCWTIKLVGHLPYLVRLQIGGELHGRGTMFSQDTQHLIFQNGNSLYLHIYVRKTILSKSCKLI